MSWSLLLKTTVFVVAFGRGWSLFFSDENKKRVYSMMRIPPERKRGIRNENSRVLDAQKSFGSLSFERTRYKYYERLKECVHHEKKADVLV